MSDAQRPIWGISRAADETGVSRDTIKRHLTRGSFPNAYQDGSKVWQIPLTDLLAAGFTPATKTAAPAVGIPTPEPVAPQSEVVELKHQLEVTRVQLEAERTLREAAERNSNDLRQSLRMIEAAKPAEGVMTPERKPWWKR